MTQLEKTQLQNTLEEINVLKGFLEYYNKNEYPLSIPDVKMIFYKINKASKEITIVVENSEFGK